MKKRIEQQVVWKAEDLLNKYDSLQQIESKLQKLEETVVNLKRGIQNDIKWVETVGANLQASEEAEKELKRLQQNNLMLQEKLRLVKGIMDSKNPNAWLYIQQMLPEAYKDSNPQ